MSESGYRHTEKGETVYSFYQDKLEEVEEILQKVLADIIHEEENVALAQYRLFKTKEQYRELMARRERMKPIIGTDMSGLYEEVQRDICVVHLLLREYNADHDHAMKRRAELLKVQGRLERLLAELSENEEHIDEIIDKFNPQGLPN